MTQHPEANNAYLYCSQSQPSPRYLSDHSGSPSRARVLLPKINELRKDFQLLHDRALALSSQASVGPQPNVWRNRGKRTLIDYFHEHFEDRTYRGLHYLDILVHYPGQVFPPLVLISIVDRGRLVQPITAAHLAEENLSVSFGGSKLEILEKEKRKRYEKELRDLQEQLEEAQSFGNDEESEKIYAKMESLTKEIKSGRGLRGKSRTMPDPESRAANSVPREVRRAIKIIRARCPLLAAHLTESLGNLIGRQCSYRPAPDTPPWDY